MNENTIQTTEKSVIYLGPTIKGTMLRHFVIFMDGINSPTRLSESDIADLVYFSRMMELVLKTR